MVTTETLTKNSPLYPAITAKHEAEETFILAGEGETREWDNPDAECGKTKYTEKCRDEHACDYPVKLIPWNCSRVECPVCYPSALKRMANKAKDHVWSTLSELKKLVPWVNWMLSSVVFLIPPELWGLDYDDLKKALRKSFKHLGTENVCVTLHLHRFKDKITGEEIEPQSVRWKEYKKNPDAFERVLSPHGHGFVIGKMVKPNVYMDKTGFGYKKMNVDAKGKTYPLTKKDVFRIIHYALSHTAISTTRRRQYVSYYGVFNSIHVIDERTDYEEVICPKCNNQRVWKQEYHNMFNEDCFGLEVPAVKKIVHRKWAFRPKWERWFPDLQLRDLDCGLDFTGYHAPIKEVEYVDLSEV